VQALHAQGAGDVAARDKRSRALVKVDLRRGRPDRQMLSVAGDDAHQPELVIKRIARARGSTRTPPTRLWGSSLSARRPYGGSKRHATLPVKSRRAFKSKDTQEGRDRAHRLQTGDPLASSLEPGVGGRMGCDHKLGRLLLDPCVLLNEARDAHALFGKYLAHRGEHSRPILGANSVVGAGDDLAHRDHTDPVVEAEGGPALDAATDRAREIDQDRK